MRTLDDIIDHHAEPPAPISILTFPYGKEPVAFEDKQIVVFSCQRDDYMVYCHDDGKVYIIFNDGLFNRVPSDHITPDHIDYYIKSGYWQ